MVALSTTALVASAVALSAGPAAALPECTVNLGPADNVYSDTVEVGDVICGGAGDDTVEQMTGGVFIGGPGDDSVDLKTGGRFYGNDGDDEVQDHYGGKFIGGLGADYVHNVYGGTYEGGPGKDGAEYVYGGGEFIGGTGDDFMDENLDSWAPDPPAVFNGGPGDDTVFDDVWGTAIFVGGRGDDRVNDTMEGVFRGGPGADFVYRLDADGLFVGGKGKDRVKMLRDPEATFLGGPEPDRVGYMDEGKFVGAKGNDRVVEFMWAATFEGGPGLDAARICGVENTMKSVETATKVDC